MDIVVRGKNRPVPSYLDTVAREKVARIAKFTHDAGRVEVDFAVQHHRRVDEAQLCEITVHLKKHFVKAHACAAGGGGRARPRGRQGRPPGGADQGEARQPLASGADRVNDNGNGAAADHGDADLDDDEEGDADARIVKTKRFAAKPMDPEEAALQMDLLGHDFFLFVNRESGSAAVLYRRHDGHFGLIETSG